MKRADKDTFKYYEDHELPMLVLATKDIYNFKSSRGFIPIMHQTAGHGCHQVYIIGMALTPSPSILDKMVVLDNRWSSTEAGNFGNSLDVILKYRRHLVTLFDVDCTLSYREFEEAIYPIDCTMDNIKKMTDDKLPEDLDDLINWKKPGSMERFCGMLNRWHLYILGRNCA